MSTELEQWEEELGRILEEFNEKVQLREGQLFLIGCSTSEVVGKAIGSAGSQEVAAMIFGKLKALQKRTGISLAFQCCEHLNRAVVVERATASRHHLDEVSVIPVRHAGGSMATYAFEAMQDAVVVEYIKGDAGIDIGDTFIGMHLKHVAVPVRVKGYQVGNAHVTLATTRPKLIGGERAVYKKVVENEQCH